jgi:hypothetical protein
MDRGSVTIPTLVERPEKIKKGDKEMVTYEEFKQQIMERVEAEIGNRAVIKQVRKNNGLKLDGLVIISEETNMSPTIYLNGYYEQYKEIMDEPDAVRSIWGSIKESYYRHLPVINFDTESFTDYERVRGNIRLKLVNYEKNEDWLDDIVFIPYLDMAIVFVVGVMLDEEGAATITVTKSHMLNWEKNAEDLLKEAIDNMKNDYSIRPIWEMLVKGIGSEGEELAESMGDFPMYVLNNRQCNNGAGLIMVSEVMREAADMLKCKDMVIIPSSVHEVILLPYGDDTDTERLNEMVKEVNQTLSPEEILSDHVYFYNTEENRVTL